MGTILITGGAGYIGSHACKSLALAGYEPIAYDNLSLGHRWAVKWGPFEEGDIADRDKIDAVIKKYKPEAVIHFAAYAYVGESMNDPGKYYRNNVAGTLTLLESMRDHQIDKIIFSSTCATYGSPKEIPILENHAQHPINPYGRSKLMIEQMLKDFDLAHGIKYISLRYFNAAGADPEGEIGEKHDPETHLIPLILDVALGRKNHVEIFGTDYNTSDGTCIRDFIHVSDLADAHLLSLKYLINHKRSNIFNLGNNNGFSVKEVIRTAENVCGKKIPSVPLKKRPGDPPVLVGSAKKAQKLLKWSPNHPELESIINTAFNWNKKLL